MVFSMGNPIGCTLDTLPCANAPSDTKAVRPSNRPDLQIASVSLQYAA